MADSSFEGKSRDLRRWPTAYDENVRYNAGTRDGQAIHEALYGEWPETDPYTYFDSVPDVPPIEDADRVKKSAFRSVSEYLASAGLSRFNEFGDCVLCNTDDFKRSREVIGLIDDWDRTLETPVVILSMFTADYVRHVQNTFLREWPLWRLHLVGTKRQGEESILIYPDLISVGHVQCPPVDVNSELRDWRERMAAIRDRHQGCRTRQWRFVLRRLPELFAHTHDFTAKLIAVFDNWEGEFLEYDVWVLQRGFGDEIQTPLDSQVASSVAFYVDTNGVQLEKITRGGTYFAVKQYTVPKNSSLSRLILDRDSDGKRWEFRVDPSTVTTDAQLKVEATTKNEICYEPLLLPLTAAPNRTPG